MLKNKIGSLVLVFGVAVCVCSCGSSNNSGTTSKGGTSGGTGGVSATGGKGGAAGSLATGGGSSAAGSAATGGAGGATSDAGGVDAQPLTLAEACTINCTLGHSTTGGDGGVDCSTTMDVCVQNCEAVFTTTSAVNASYGTLYTRMMVCIATDPKFATAAGFICAKPNRAVNKWSPGPDSSCETAICLWNCDDAADSDPFIDLRCTCSSV